MGGHDLEQLFKPNSIAVVGAREKPNSVGMVVFKNLIENKFPGKIYPVNIRHNNVQGFSAFKRITEIPDSIDLVLIATPASTVPNILKDCSEKNIHTVVIFSAGFNESGDTGKKLETTCLEIAKKFNIRIIGPNCLGVLFPHYNLNATFSNIYAKKGQLALISQSGALCVSILDWAKERNIGFSSVISIGNAIDVDFGEILDYLSSDPNTQSVLLYVESIHKARSFMKGVKACARNKPVIVIKAGRFQDSSKAALSHTGALIGDDDVFETALKRCGAIRVYTLEELFSAAEILSHNFKLENNSLTIITNGGGTAVMAADEACLSQIELSTLSASVIEDLNKILPPFWSNRNPIDILGNATPENFHDVISVCLNDPKINAILVILVPVIMSKPVETAQIIIELCEKTSKPILCCWLGNDLVKAAKKMFTEHNIPSFDTPEEAVQAFSYLAKYHSNQSLLKQAIEPIISNEPSDVESANHIINSALSINSRGSSASSGRKVLTLSESKAILNAFKIPTTQTIICHSDKEAIKASESLGFPVVMKISSPDISHKQEVHGVQLNITTLEGVQKAFNQITETAKRLRPQAFIEGVTIEKMINQPNDRELMIGTLKDNTFGPVISFGLGGSIVEIMHDRALSLPPLNLFLAKELINQTKVSKFLQQFRDMPAVKISEIENILIRVSEMICKLPAIQEMDINPLIANDQFVVAVDARIVVEHTDSNVSPYAHLAIDPYSNF